jgi:acetyltransferase-like isoleucine patch superfamily enzyme
MKTNALLSSAWKLLIVILPWSLKRRVLNHYYKYELSPSAYIGLAWVFPSQMRLGPHARIASLTVAIHLDLIDMGEKARIGRSNWITGFPTGTNSPHFSHQVQRRAELVLGEHSAITKNHHIDCTNRIRIGAFTTIAGYRSQLLTHAIDLKENRQNSEPIEIGNYCFVGSSCIILGGSKLPDYSVLGAMSLLNKCHDQTWSLYAGQPARWLKSLDRNSGYFKRQRGSVD